MLAGNFRHRYVYFLYVAKPEASLTLVPPHPPLFNERRLLCSMLEHAMLVHCLRALLR